MGQLGSYSLCLPLEAVYLLQIATVEVKTIDRQAAPHRKWRALTKGNVIRVLQIMVVLLLHSPLAVISVCQE